jgi:predicted transcriptional regulator
MNQMRNDTAVSFDDMLDVLIHIQRRKLLVALMDHNPQDDTPVVVGSEEEATSLDQLVQMKHVHLPKMVEYGFIEWDRDSHEVSKGQNFAEIRPLLELLDDHQDELPDGWL